VSYYHWLGAEAEYAETEDDGAVTLYCSPPLKVKTWSWDEYIEACHALKPNFRRAAGLI
jgi:hypothetical protein